jgi:hypothetical protein
MINKNFAFGYVLFCAVVTRYFFTTDQIISQIRYMGRWEPFWHSNICIGKSCKLPAAKCFTNMKCAQTIGCIQTCLLDNIDSEDKIAACAYICEMTYGYENNQFKEMIDCMLKNECLLEYPEDGPCKGSNADAITSVKTMEDIEGDWWVLRGINCGEGVYPGGYDWYPCQHERFIKSANGQWINNVTYCGGKHDQCSTDIIVTIANVSMPAPGVVNHKYTDAPLDPQEEDWRLVSMPHPDYALMLWCGRLPVLDYAGGIVISRHRDDSGMPAEVVQEFRDVLKKHDIDWDKTCPSNNNHCPE